MIIVFILIIAATSVTATISIWICGNLLSKVDELEKKVNRLERES